ncbi:LysR family substrate-binding domain-containing protein [Dactylosporangium darangshiense]|uniref:LysR family substrate-binding domain-containing protein n=1 Tax=Dactylosporangium darangshiense TaxID=579108 RepID=UPI00362827D8
MKAGADAGLVPEILRRYREQPAPATVDVHVCGVAEQATLLRTGEADMALLHLPHDDASGFDTKLLHVDGQIAVLPQGHRLAGRRSIRLDDLSGETLPRWRDVPGTGPVVRDGSQLMQLIALGETIALLPAASEAYLRRDLVAVPVEDAGPISLVLAWPERSRSTALAAFVRTAVATARSARPGSSAPPEPGVPPEATPAAATRRRPRSRA